MSRIPKFVVLTLSFLVFSYVGLGYVLGQTGGDDSTYRSLTVYSEVLQRVQEDYVDEPNLAVVTAGAMPDISAVSTLVAFTDEKRAANSRPHSFISIGSTW